MNQVQVSTKHKVVVVPTQPALQNLFPDAKLLGNTHMVLPHGMTETFILRRYGFDVPSPIDAHYDWAGGTPFDTQRKTCSVLTLNPRAYVLNDKGTGKTKSALWAWDYLYSVGACKKLLVVAPLSTLTFTWAKEVFETVPHRKCVVLHGSSERRLKRLADPDADIFIVNHDGLKVVQAAISDMVKAGAIDTLVLDELAIYRNGQSARTKSMIKFAEQMRWCWGMTGSPIPNDPTDVWAQARIITPASVPKYYGRFRDDLMVKISQFKYAPKNDAVERAFAALQPAVRYTLSDVVELPECVEQTLEVELGAKQAKVYKELAASCYSLVQKQEITAANAGAVLMKLLQVSCGWVYTKDGSTVALDNGKRVAALIDAVTSTDQKVLVFVGFKHALAGVSEAMTKEGIEHAVVSGDTPSGKRADIFNAFQNTNKYKAIVAHPQCLAHGITLTAANVIVWFGPVTSLEIYDQACARIRRVGQKFKQLILHLQSTPIEKKIYAMLASKQKVQDKLLELFEAASV